LVATEKKKRKRGSVTFEQPEKRKSGLKSTKKESESYKFPMGKEKKNPPNRKGGKARLPQRSKGKKKEEKRGVDRKKHAGKGKGFVSNIGREGKSLLIPILKGKR